MKRFSLRDLVAETYVDDESKFYGFADRGNGAAFGERGRTLPYDEDAARAYGDIALTACSPIASEDGRAEYVYASEWQDAGNGYQFRILF